MLGTSLYSGSTGAGDWSAPVTVDYAGIVALDCPTTTLCLALDSGNNLVSSTNSTGGVWTSQEQVAVLPLG